MISVYLSGPIALCDDTQCKDWRNYLKENYSGRFKFLDPMRRDYRHLDTMETQSTFEEQKKIVSLDKVDIERCDSIIVWTGKPFPSVGTSMEVIYAYERGKLVVTVNPYLNTKLSPWLYFHSHKVVNTLDDGMAAILERLSDFE